MPYRSGGNSVGRVQRRYLLYLRKRDGGGGFPGKKPKAADRWSLQQPKGKRRGDLGKKKLQGEKERRVVAKKRNARFLSVRERRRKASWVKRRIFRGQPERLEERGNLQKRKENPPSNRSGGQCKVTRRGAGEHTSNKGGDLHQSLCEGRQQSGNLEKLQKGERKLEGRTASFF